MDSEIAHRRCHSPSGTHHALQTLGFYGKNKSLGDGVQIWAPRWQVHYVHAGCLHHPSLSGVGYWNVNGGDMKLLQVMLDKINAGLCIDQQRIFSTEFSFGGMMSYTVGFQFKNVFRAVAPCQLRARIASPWP
jgi:hypothetical protein